MISYLCHVLVSFALDVTIQNAINRDEKDCLAESH